jgi:hypothetical protein
MFDWSVSDVSGVLSSWDAIDRNSSRERIASWASVEARVLEGHARAVADLLGGPVVAVGEAAAEERERPEELVFFLQRHEHRQVRVDGARW